MRGALVGTPLAGASVTSGTLSAVQALGAGDVTINTVALPAVALAATAAERCDQMVAAVNSVYSLTGVSAVKVTSTTFKLVAGVNIVVAALAGAATAANCGLTAGTTSATDTTLASRKVFGSGASGTDSDVVKVVGMEIDVKSARTMGLIENVLGAAQDVAAVAAPTRTDA